MPLTDQEIAARQQAVISHLQFVPRELPSWLVNFIGDPDTAPSAALLAGIYAAGEAGLSENASRQWYELVQETAMNISILALVADGALSTGYNDEDDLTFKLTELGAEIGAEVVGKIGQ